DGSAAILGFAGCAGVRAVVLDVYVPAEQAVVDFDDPRTQALDALSIVEQLHRIANGSFDLTQSNEAGVDKSASICNQIMHTAAECHRTCLNSQELAILDDSLDLRGPPRECAHGRIRPIPRSSRARRPRRTALPTPLPARAPR